MTLLEQIRRRIDSWLRFPEVSYSRVSAYLQCPWMYHLMYEKGWRAGPTARSSLGLTVHRTLEEYHRSGSFGRDPLFEIYDRLWVNEGFARPQEAFDFYQRGQKMLENYWAFQGLREARIIGAEKEFFFRRGRFRFRGTVDRLDQHPDGSFELMEYKTHEDPWSQPRVDSDLQMTLYSAACRKAWGIIPQRLSILFLAKGERVETRRSRRQEAQALELVKTVASRIAAQDFEPHYDHCPQCDFKTRCPRSRHGVSAPA
jgi:RecB family exonuclease